MTKLIRTLIVLTIVLTAEPAHASWGRTVTLLVQAARKEAGTHPHAHKRAIVLMYRGCADATRTLAYAEGVNTDGQARSFESMLSLSVTSIGRTLLTASRGAEHGQQAEVDFLCGQALLQLAGTHH